MISQTQEIRPIVDQRHRLAGRYREVRDHSRRICLHLEAEDFVVQSMPDVSPLRWHLAHTTWFFETFILKRFADYRPVCEQFEYLFNSYYNGVGDQFPRDRRGLLSRPTVAEILDYRAAVDEKLLFYLGRDLRWSNGLLELVELGMNHEQQHQELMLTDIKHVLSCNPINPTYEPGEFSSTAPQSQGWVEFSEGLHEIGSDGAGFSFDNELPRHRVFVEPFQLSDRLVTNGEYLRFIDDGGYEKSEFWLTLGWNEVSQHRWTAPLYWRQSHNGWSEFTLAGLQELNLSLPVTHVSYFEADAYARWAESRLPTEAEWEIASSSCGSDERSAEDLFEMGRTIHPSHEGLCDKFRSLFGSVWQWTSSSYSPYPGYRPPAGAIGEYNGKFMCNQYVLRGSSCATPRFHSRSSYRNFFPPGTRWQFSGIRLARS